MVMRAGSYDKARPQWRGVIREDSYPYYVCTHAGHDRQSDATACARKALAAFKATGSLPPGWVGYDSTGGD